METKGKKFEEQLRKNWIETVPDSFIYRLADQVSGYKTTSRNPCDFIAYKYPHVFLLEAKAHAGNTLPFSAIRQLDLLFNYIGITGVKAGVVAWMYDHDRVIWIPAESLKKMVDDGKKSFNVKDTDYDIIDIPSKKLRTFMKSDYSILTKNI